MFIAHPDSSINLLLSKSGSILDFGCGDGGYSRHISKFYDSVDLFDYEDIINSIDPDISDISKMLKYYEKMKKSFLKVGDEKSFLDKMKKKIL